jgi:uncharacterized membrane protein
LAYSLILVYKIIWRDRLIIVTLFYQEGNEACNLAKKQLESLQSDISHQLVIVNIDKDPSLLAKYRDSIPMVKVGPYTLVHPFTREELKVTLAASADREKSIELINIKQGKSKALPKKTVTRADRFTLWFSQWYIWVFCLMIGFFVGIPFMAPVFMKINLIIPAKVIYAVYSPLCHQYAFRSWFLFGEQSFYPRKLAGFTKIKTYDDISGTKELDSLQAKKFDGNSIVGYKVALCERDVAIWGSLFLFALFFQLTGRKIKPYRWAIYIWVILGLVPIGIDGVSQLPSILGTFGLPWLPIRESTPLLRTLTGSLFGLSTGFYLFPQMEETIQDTRRMILHKIAVIMQLNPPSN